MIPDIRAAAARFYDLQPSPFDGKDVPFYISLLPSPAATVLELGCGTGRVLLPLAAQCAHIHGVDISEAMVDICRDKLLRAGVSSERATLQVADICRLDLGRRFDLIIAPFRVLQNLETDEQVDALFAVVRRHLAPAGTCVLNVYRPYAAEQVQRQRWAARSQETLDWERPLGAGRLVAYECIRGVHPTKMICYPRLIHRYYEGDVLKDEAVLDIAMRAYYAGEFEDLIMRRGFRVLNKWGGYAGETYGEGPELVLQFAGDREVISPALRLDALMDEISKKAVARGLTPEILESLLNDR